MVNDMSEWRKVADELPYPDNEVEIEVAFWDGVYMCRMFGAYTEDGFYVGEAPLEPSFKVTHWKECYPLPEPPTQPK